jgi:hypothetical protein
MTDGEAVIQPGAEEVGVPFRPRGSYAGYRAFGTGDGAVLLEPEVARNLRTAAEFATQEGRITGGLLYGRGWADEEGAYLVIDGYLEGGPGENRGDRISADGTDNFTLSEADLRLLREDGARMYSAFLEMGWWRTLPALGEFGPRDFVTQAELVGPDGVGLLVYGSGIHWGTAYLGPEGRAPDTAGTLVVSVIPALTPEPDAGLAPPRPEVVDIAAGDTLLPEPEPEPLPGDATPSAAVPPTVPPRRRVRRGAAAPVGTAARRWAAGRASIDNTGPGVPSDVQFVIGALILVTVAVAIIVGVLVHSVIVALIIAIVGFVVITSSIWLSRR